MCGSGSGHHQPACGLLTPAKRQGGRVVLEEEPPGFVHKAKIPLLITASSGRAARARTTARYRELKSLSYFTGCLSSPNQWKQFVHHARRETGLKAKENESKRLSAQLAPLPSYGAKHAVAFGLSSEGHLCGEH